MLLIVFYVACTSINSNSMVLKSKLTGKQCKEMLETIDSTPSGKQWRDLTISEGNELSQVDYHIIQELIKVDIQTNEAIQYENDCKKLHLVTE